MQIKKVAIIGLGHRGDLYASFAKTFPEKFELVAIVDTSDEKRQYALKQYPNIPFFIDIKDFLKQKISADIVMIATQDSEHREHSISMMEAGYDLLLEKPISNFEEDCMDIYKTSKRLKRRVIVCHVLRYSPFYSRVKEIIKSGRLGEIVTINASENVSYFHQANSFVRGPWRNKEESSPMILAKCCHDMDIIRYLMDEKCISVSSYGDLYAYKAENAPINSSEYCSDCQYSDCIYKSQKLYTTEEQKWCAGYFTRECDNDKILKDLTHTPYDRCVYKCDNNVVDHQVTIMRFENGKTACHTMTAFSKEIYRDLKIHATKAELVGSIEGNFIEIREFGGMVERIEVDTSEAVIGGHMGGDFFMMDSIFRALNGENVMGVTYLDVSIESHLMCFAAEKSRLNGGNAIRIKTE